MITASNLTELRLTQRSYKFLNANRDVGEIGPTASVISVSLEAVSSLGLNRRNNP